MSSDGDGSFWGPVPGSIVRTSDTLDLLDPSNLHIENRPRIIPNDPEKVEFVRKFRESLFDNRERIKTYNVVLLAVLVIISAWHLYCKWRDLRKWRARLARSGATQPRLEIGEGAKRFDNSPADVPSSSSSSTLEGSVQSNDSLKKHSIAQDLERQPLLGTSPPVGGRSWGGLSSLVHSWLIYQPRPIPFINRALPSNGTTLFVLAYYGLNLFYHCYKLPVRADFAFLFADWAGCNFMANLPLLYLLAAKNQPVKHLTGYSYEALNIFHRRVGELCCLEAAIHAIGMLLWEFAASPEWFRIPVWEYLVRRLVIMGFGALISYELLYFASLGSFRQRWYELFLASHIVLQIAALVFLFFHYHTARPYVVAAVTIYTLDRLVWRISLKSTKLSADLSILDDGKTLRLSADWDIPCKKMSRFFNISGHSILHGWEPADHVFLTVPDLGRTHALQTHPFTIASAAPRIGSSTKYHPTHAWFSLLIREQSGFTSDLIRYAESHTSVPVRVDGPYGSQDALDVLRASDTAVLIAGGSGIAVLFPLLWALIHEPSSSQKVHLMWVIHSRPQRSWLPEDRIAELEEAGIHVTIPEPTDEAGRPDIAGYIANISGASDGREVGLVISGPDGLNRTARNAAANIVRGGAHITICVEKFGW